MMPTETATPARRFAFLRWGLPPLLVLLAGVAAAAVWAWPGDGLDRATRVFIVLWGLTPATVLLLAGWLVFFSGLSWRAGLSAVLVVGLALGAFWFVAVRDVRFTGDMIPLVSFRWSPTPDDLLEADRKRTSPGELGPVHLSFNPADSFPEYRGPARDGVVHGPALARDWKANPPRLLWRRAIGGGYGSFAVAGNIAVTLEQRREEEAVACYDTVTGQERWTHSYPAHFSETLGGSGPRATPTIAGDEVFSLGATGVLVCLDARTGTPKWSTNVIESGNENVRWGMSGSPLVLEHEVVVCPGVQTDSAPGGTVVAYDRATGKKLWRAGRARTAYCSPMLATLCGRRQVVLFDGDGVAGYDLADHRELWRHPWQTQEHIHAAQPLVLEGDRVFITSGYGVGCAMLRVKQADGRWSAEVVWKNRLLRGKFASPIAFKGSLYGLDDGVLVCLDEQKGTRRWRGPRLGHGQLLLADGLLVIQAEDGQLVLAEADPAGYHEHGRITVFEDRTWNPPALAGGKAYLRNDREMACYDLRAARGGDVRRRVPHSAALSVTASLSHAARFTARAGRP